MDMLARSSSATSYSLKELAKFGRPGLSKYSLRRSEAGHLLEICAAFGVQGSIRLPDYEWIAREVEDMRLAKCV